MTFLDVLATVEVCWFLDILIRNRVTDSTIVYRKPAYTGQYINVDCDHPDHVKRGVIKMYSRAVGACPNESLLREEVENICREFSKNCYGNHYVKLVIYRVGRGKTPDNAREMRGSAIIPYIRDILENARRGVRKFGLPFA